MEAISALGPRVILCASIGASMAVVCACLLLLNWRGSVSVSINVDVKGRDDGKDQVL